LSLQFFLTGVNKLPLGISGLGGIGKTQTALEYAYRYRTDYEAVFWIRADSVTWLNSSLVELARVLELPERNEQDQKMIVQAVLLWFRHHPDWLLIYDNIDDFSLAEPFLPKAGPGHLLFTTRAHAFGEFAQRLDIEKMEPEIGALLLLRRASLLAIQATLNMANPDDQSAARIISQELDGLPLALDQAGAYIKETPCPLPDYLSRYQTRRSDILRKRGSFNQDYPASVATTWSLSFEKVSQANPAAAELLDFCAFLAPATIPEEIITEAASHLGPVLSPVATDPVLLDLACKDVLRFSLFHRGVDEHTLSMHSLVQSVLRETLDEQDRKQWMQRTVHAVNGTFPDLEFRAWSQCDRWLPHALTCALWIAQGWMTFPEAALLLNQAGYYLNKRARYAEAEPLYVRALEIYEQQLGADHPHTAASLNNLAELYRSQGKYAEAEPLYVRALEIYEQQLGLMPRDTAQTINNLAVLYYTLGKYAEAEPLLKRALTICEPQLEATNPTRQTIYESYITLQRILGLDDTEKRF
jgi:tetratricopeptide (TPR) repeat protein